MDYRYEVPEEGRNFHKQRKAFIILNDTLEFLPDGTPMSHFEYCQTKSIDKNTFNKITRGFYLNGDVVFYKDNFIYDEDLINEALRYLDEISSKVSVKEFEIYFGLLLEDKFPYNYHYGKYSNGIVSKIS